MHPDKLFLRRDRVRTLNLERSKRVLLGIFGAAVTLVAGAQPAQPPANWKLCATESQPCNFAGAANVRYGANGTFVTKRLVGGAMCISATFGRDPTPNVKKECQYDEASRAPVDKTLTGQAVTASNAVRGATQGTLLSGTAPAAGQASPGRPVIEDVQGVIGQQAPANQYGAAPVPGRPPAVTGAAPANQYGAAPAPGGQAHMYGPGPAAEAPQYHAPPVTGAAPAGQYGAAPAPGGQAHMYGPGPAAEAPQYHAPPVTGAAPAGQYGAAPAPGGQAHMYGPGPAAEANQHDAPPVGGVRPQYDAPPVVNARPQYDAPPVVNARPQYDAPPVVNARPQYDAPPVVNARPQYDAPPAVAARPSGTYDVVPLQKEGNYAELTTVPKGQSSVYSQAPASPYGDLTKVPKGQPAIADTGKLPQRAPAPAAPHETTPEVTPHLGAVAGVAGAGVGGAVVGAGGALIAEAAQGNKITYHAPTTWNTNTTTKDMCWRDSYPNGGGVVQNGCPAGREWRDSMCYVKCNPGETGSMTMCKSDCPAGWRTDPLTCWHDTSIISADNSNCPWYDKCGVISAKGCSTCPAGYHNDGCTCRIDAQATARTRDVGIGLAGSGCQAGYSKDPSGLLCYPTCKSGYQMVGPACWDQKCPADYPVQCGASCAVSQAACAQSTESQVLTPLQVITNVVGIAVTGGGSAAADVAAGAAEGAAEAAAKASIAASLKTAAAQAGKNLTESAVSSASSTMAAASVTGQFDYYSLDPTGVAAVVEAYNKPICNVPATTARK